MTIQLMHIFLPLEDFLTFLLLVTFVLWGFSSVGFFPPVDCFFGCLVSADAFLALVLLLLPVLLETFFETVFESRTGFVTVDRFVLVIPGKYLV